MTWCQYPGMVFGLLGALLVSAATPRSLRAGFACWIVSNAFLIAYALHEHAYGLFFLYAFYSATSAWGLRNAGRAAA
jgi:hypothetical protein